MGETGKKAVGENVRIPAVGMVFKKPVGDSRLATGSRPSLQLTGRMFLGSFSGTIQAERIKDNLRDWLLNVLGNVETNQSVWTGKDVCK